MSRHRHRNDIEMQQHGHQGNNNDDIDVVNLMPCFNCEGNNPIKCGIGSACGCVVFWVIFGLIIGSISYVEWNELAFQKNTLSNVVDKDQVYTNGRYFWGPSITKLTFPSIFQKISYRGNDLLVFAGGEDENNTAAAGLEFGIECDVYYRLNPDDLKEIFNDFGTAYHERFVDTIKASIKNTAPEFSVDDYVNNRQEIAERMREEINNDIERLNLAIEPHKFMLLRIVFPARVLQKFEATVMKELEIDKSILTRNVDLYKKGTEELVSKIKANVTIVNESADARARAITERGTAQAEAIGIEAEGKARAIRLNAEAESVRIHEEALGNGVNLMMSRLNATDPRIRNKLFQLFTIMDSPNAARVMIGDEDTLLNVG